jgi:Fic family protein
MSMGAEEVVRAYIEAEVHRQGYANGTTEHEQRSDWMEEAWWWMIGHSLSVESIEELGKMVEREKNERGYRRIEVRVGGRICPPSADVPVLMRFFVRYVAQYAPALEAYRTFQLIHPFTDGNGRVGKIVYNWLLGALAAPRLPQDLFDGGVP